MWEFSHRDIIKGKSEVKILVYSRNCKKRKDYFKGRRWNEQYRREIRNEFYAINS
jgi:hypothetical protein